MDTHLATISATLDAIDRLHASSPSSSKNTYRPFTCAVLNTYKLDVLDYIRDADQVESNLFWYPPLAGTAGGPSGAVSGEAKVPDDSAIPALTRIPEPKEFIPPTPLRKTAREAESKGLVEFSARTLLKAAQRLLDNYHQAPRARKHIRALLKRHAELEKQKAQYESSIADSDQMIERLSNPTTTKEAVAALMGSSRPPDVVDEDIRKLQDAIRNEMMEILAIEQTTEDLLDKRQKMLAQRARKVQMAPTLPLNHGGSITPTAAAAREHIARLSDTKQDALPTGSEGANIREATIISEVNGEVILPEDIDNTIRGSTENATVRQEYRSAETKDSSDELERICESIWSLFGDSLRYVAADREGGSYKETLQILSSLSLGGKQGSAGDESTMSYSSDSQATAATTGSSGSSHLENAGAPPPAIAVASHVLHTLLTTPAPHVMDIEELKADAEAWWDRQGRQTYLSSAAGKENAVDEGTSSDLASRAVFRLVAKKILRLQFRGAKRIISFPAHIG